MGGWGWGLGDTHTKTTAGKWEEGGGGTRVSLMASGRGGSHSLDVFAATCCVVKSNSDTPGERGEGGGGGPLGLPPPTRRCRPLKEVFEMTFPRLMPDTFLWRRRRKGWRATGSGSGL